MRDKDLQIIEKIIKRVCTTLRYCEDETQDSFHGNTMLQEACVFNLLQIGELANHLSSEFTAANASIPWHQMVGLRNRLVHDYDGIRLTIVWETITNDFPKLRPQLEKLL